MTMKHITDLALASVLALLVASTALWSAAAQDLTQESTKGKSKEEIRKVAKQRTEADEGKSPE